MLQTLSEWSSFLIDARKFDTVVLLLSVTERICCLINRLHHCNHTKYSAGKSSFLYYTRIIYENRRNIHAVFVKVVFVSFGSNVIYFGFNYGK
jgi:hypothetical protein